MFKFNAVPNKFSPLRGSTYYSINTTTLNKAQLGVRKHKWTGDKFDRARAAINNVFRTVDQAKAVRNTIVGTLKLAQQV